jgi:hypothetical protein
MLNLKPSLNHNIASLFGITLSSRCAQYFEVFLSNKNSAKYFGGCGGNFSWSFGGKIRKGEREKRENC